ncbi:MAG: hypothetical protein NVS3B9_2210 [Candidatus Doudnabacteria bacterium]
MAYITNIKLAGKGLLSGSDSLPNRTYNNVFQKAQDFKEETLASNIETERIEYGLGILEALLALRFAFDLFNASTLNILAKLVDIVTFPFIAPFFVVFGKEPSYALSTGQLQTLAAMLVYPILVWSLLALYKNAKARNTSIAL